MKSTFTRRSVATSSTLLASTAAFALAAFLAPLIAQGAWKQLFDGKDLTGWTVPAGGRADEARAAGTRRPRRRPRPTRRIAAGRSRTG